jgi:hypothetical protein
MNAQLLQSYVTTGTALPDSVADELAACNKKNPWFAAGHFLEAVFHQQKKLSEAEQSVQKALFYSNDPAWFSWQYRRLTEQGQTAGHMKEEVERVAEEQSQDEEDAVADALALIETEDAAEATVMNAVADAELLVEAANHIDEMKPVTIAETTTTAHPEEIVVQPQENVAIFPSEKELTTTQEAAPKEPFLFEPFHTVDYFASQGIRLQEEKLGNDDLSKQVKTFTQWLRTMKKTYTNDHLQLEQQQEAEVLGIANHSNQPEEILTETMARVLQQQGKKAKAAEIYHKLSLLHPEKSAYFAALIHDLNEEK